MGGEAAVAETAPGLQVAVKAMMALPPVLAGAANEMIADWFPAVPDTPVGAAGAVPTIAKPCVTATAASKSTLPAWLAVIVHVPVVRNVTTEPETEQTPRVPDENVSGRPDDAAAPGIVNGEALNGCPPMVLNVMLWDRFATTNVKFCVPVEGLPLFAVKNTG